MDTTIDTLGIALKEWHTVCLALASGRQILLLRKGGISETGGEFTIEHNAFLLFPTFLHQNKNLLKSDALEYYEPLDAEPGVVKLETFARVTDILKLPSRAVADQLNDEHIWTPPLLDMRFSYKPDRPLYLMVVRAYRLFKAIEIENTPAYAGCKSWVPLKSSVDLSRAVAAIDDDAFEARRDAIKRIAT